jgi:hypothetical protein
MESLNLKIIQTIDDINLAISMPKTSEVIKI